jgi:hypothetical protein
VSTNVFSFSPETPISGLTLTLPLSRQGRGGKEDCQSMFFFLNLTFIGLTLALPSPLPSPKRLRAGRHQGRGKRKDVNQFTITLQFWIFFTEF